jgi:hypothetical protein
MIGFLSNFLWNAGIRDDLGEVLDTDLLLNQGVCFPEPIFKGLWWLSGKFFINQPIVRISSFYAKWAL